MRRGGNEWAWRLTVCGERQYHICLARRDGVPIGYVVVRRMTPGASRILGRREGAIITDLVAAADQPAVLRALDVTLLHALMIEQILGIDREAQAAQTNLRYVKDTGHALSEARSAQAVFVMNPTKVHEVKAVADAGEVMPQKSTFFYPKLASGLVINPLDPAELV